ncbi:TIGR03084 family metal-binding protein [Desulfospira joergensenii]|uniref:TIGR03084 family metal-binding protein n=1 Tax=Desulfospira joergensenii TaxID=53329 RepID=UPI000489CCBD|nr:TIGR03084 family metal-binding protein [Desulfospira joergensenii]
MQKICSDLKQEYEALDSLVFTLDRRKWDLPTLFYDWTLFDQVLHIAFFDHEALLALKEPDRFRKRAKKILGHIGSGQPWPQWTQTMSGVRSPAGLLSYWRTVRARLVQRLARLDPQDRLPWYGPDMSARSLASARIMETWAHGQDIFDALGKKRENRARLYHVAHMGVTTFGWSFRIRGQDPPAHTPCILLLGPGNESWEWNEPGCQGKVRGRAEEFCLVVTQRRNLADTRLKWEGDRVGEWLSMAQAFAGIPQDPPLPGVRVVEYEPRD